MAMQQMQQYIKVTLSYEEEILAHGAGWDRAKEINWTGTNHQRRRNMLSNYHDFIAELSESVASEMVVAKWLGIKDFKPTINGFKNVADIAGNIEVKWSRWHDAHLILHEYDRDTDVAFLVVGKSPTYYIVGWSPVALGKARQHWVQAERNWWIPQIALMPPQSYKGSMYAAI